MTTIRTITEYTTNQPNETRMVLRPLTLNSRETFRNILNRRFENNIDELPYISNYNGVESLDSNIIIELNNSTSSERRIAFMESIINRENINDNSLYLLSNSTNQVRTYLHDLLIRSASFANIREEDLYRVGNILLYTIANMNEESLFIRDIIQFLRENMIIYNTEQIVHILENNVTIYNNYLENIHLSTEEQLNERTEEFYDQINERIFQNRRRVLYAGLGLVGSMALTSMGLPPIGSVVARTMSNITSNSNHSFENSVRLRDIWDVSLKKILDIIKNI